MKSSTASSEIINAQFGRRFRSLGCSCGKAKRRRDYLGPTSKKMKKTNKQSFVTSYDGTPWVRTRLIGRGSFGTVYHAVTDDGKEMAVKSTKMSRASSLMEETRILQGLSSPYIVTCLGDEITTETEDGEQYYNIMLEYCPSKSLLKLIGLYRYGLPERQVKELATDILNGLSYIHCRHIIHGDIKPDNILLVPRVRWLRPHGLVAKIADFGLALEKDSVEYHELNHLYPRGTTRYMSPELAADRVLDYAGTSGRSGVPCWRCLPVGMLGARTHSWTRKN